MKKNDIPAFPCERKEKDETFHSTIIKKYQGMTLREYYAGQALVGLLVDKPDNMRAQSFAEVQKVVAHAAVAYADALIAELEGGE